MSRESDRLARRASLAARGSLARGLRGPIPVGAISDYSVQYSTNNGRTWTTFRDAASSATTATVTGLANGVAHVFRVAAMNIAGTGGFTARSAAVTPRTIPGAPTALSGVAGNGRVTLSWTAPRSNGGAAIGDYLVQYSGDNGATWTTFADGTSSATRATVTGLTRGTSYVFQVAATNAVGTGAFSARSRSVRA